MPSVRKRLHFVDVLRLIALLQMVNGHTLNAVLRDDVRHGDVYAGYLWFRGLISVAFMLVAGLAFFLTTVARPGARTPAERSRRILRAFEIIAIGFLLRMPLSAIAAGDAHAIARGLSTLAHIDVLPCIGVSLLVLEGLFAIWSSPRAIATASAGLCLVTAFASGWGASLPPALPWGYLTGWLGPQGGSAFPLLPYSGYVFAGVVLGAVALPLAAATTAPRAALRLCLSAALLFGVSRVFAFVPAPWLGAQGPLIHTPAFFMLKLAVVALAAAALAFGTRNLTKLPQSLATLTAETLGIYVFHLFVLYGWPFALARRVGQTLSLPAALGVSAGMLAASVTFGLVWRRAKTSSIARSRWPLIRSTAIAVATGWIAVVAFPLAALGGERTEATLPSVLSVSLPVTDLTAAERFLARSFGFRRQGGVRPLSGEAYAELTGMPGLGARSQQLQVGAERIELVAFDPPGRAIPSDSQSDDLWFQHLALVTRDLDRSVLKLSASQPRSISAAPQTLPASNLAAAGIRAFYFEGPATHPLELIWYPKDKGAARWHLGRRGRSADDILGIDHTAIAVSNTERSQRFYTELLGLRVTGGSLNFGVEQAALSGVPAARVRITGLRGASGLGIEFLEYESPRRGRPIPADTRANDLWRSVIAISVPDLARTVLQLRAAGASFVSPDIREVAGVFDAPARAIDVLDPDGHALRLVQR